jgi:hypothetical protein
MFVLNRPLASDVNTDTTCASPDRKPGTIIPTVGTGAVEYRRLVTRTDVPELVNSAVPADDGASKTPATMSSNARDSRAESVNVACGAAPGHVPRKHRYTAVTETGEVYDVLKTRTSEKKGAAAEPGGREATAGSVRVSAGRVAEVARNKRTRACTLPTGPLDDDPGDAVY